MFRVADMARELSDILGRRVDIHVRAWLPPHQRRAFARADHVPLGSVRA